MSKIKFKTRQDYVDYLKNTLEQISLNGEYNIFMHEIFLFNHEEYLEGGEFKANSILSTGLEVRKYPSMFGTMKLMGDSKNIDVNKLIDYYYTGDKTGFNSVLFAIPKNISINEKEFPFSEQTPLSEKFIEKLNYNKRPDSPNGMHNVIDVTKGYHNLDKSFAIGYQYVDNTKGENGEYSFVENDKPFALLSKTEQTPILDSYADKFLRVVESTKPTDFEDLLIKSTDKWNKEQERIYDDYI